MTNNLTTAPVITSMIKQHQDAQAAAAAKAKAERDTAVAESIKKCREVFAAIIDELQVPGDDQLNMISSYSDDAGSHIGVTMPARLVGWEPVHQFYLCWKLRVGGLLSTNTQYFGHSSYGIRFDADNEAAVAKFFADQQKEYEQALQRYNDQLRSQNGLAINARSAQLSPRRASHGDDPAKADEALATLIDLDPKKEADWRDLHARYMAAYHTAVAEHEAAQAELKQKVACARQYHLDYREFVDACEAVDQKNADAVAEIQNQYGGNFMLYDLEYAVAARDDEDGEVYVETETAKVLHPAPDSGGWYTTVNRSGQVERKRFFHPVSVSDAKVHSTSDRVYAGRVNHGGHAVYFPPDATDQIRDEVIAKVEAAHTSLPQGPDYLLPWDHYLVNRLQSPEPISGEEIARFF